MKSSPRIKKCKVSPLNSIIHIGFPKLDYCDSFSLEIATSVSNDAIVNHIFGFSGWTKVLFRLRDFLVKPFGLETGGDKGKLSDFYAVGEKAVFFKVIDRNEVEMVMGGNDKHLQARLSVQQIENNHYNLVYLTTIVHFNNLGGRIYFMLVKPFHIIIIRSMLNKLYKSIHNENK